MAAAGALLRLGIELAVLVALLVAWHTLLFGVDGVAIIVDYCGVAAAACSC